MESFHKFAGVQDAYDPAEAPPQPASIAVHPPPPVPKDDAPSQQQQSTHGGNASGSNSQPNSAPHSRQPSRASMPLNRKASMKSVHSGRSKRRGGDGGSSAAAWKNDESVPPTPRLSAHPSIMTATTNSQRGSEAGGITKHTKTAPSAEADAKDKDFGPGMEAQTPTTVATTRDDDDGFHTGEHSVAASHHHPHSDAEDDDEEEEGEDEEFAWGPAHPCFPHPNPHAAPGSALAAGTRVIRIRRDWLAAGDLCPQFANLYPEILEVIGQNPPSDTPPTQPPPPPPTAAQADAAALSDADFRDLIAHLNTLCRAAFATSTAAAWRDALFGAFTGYLWDDLGFTTARRGEKAIERFIERWNAARERRERAVGLIPAGARRRVGAKGEEIFEDGDEGAVPRGVRVVQLRRTGYLSLDLVVPDPGIDGVGGGAAAGTGEVEGEGTTRS